jgi:hypothetical protein
MATVDEFSAALGNGAKSLASTTFADFQGQAEADAAAFIAKMEADLRRWTGLLSRQSITGEDFRDLLQAKKALVEVHELRQVGVARTRLERFRTGLINLIVDTAFDVFL